VKTGLRGAFSYFNRDASRAETPLLTERAGGAKPTRTYNRFTGMLSGPIFKDRTFFMIGGEHLKDVQPEPASYTVPTARMRAGDFSEFPNLVYDPLHRPKLAPRHPDRRAAHLLMYPSRVHFRKADMKSNAHLFAAVLLAASSHAQTAPAPRPAAVALAAVVVRNDAAFARRETIEVSLKSLPGVGKPADLRRVRVRDEATGQELLAQAMDTDGDYDEDTLVFQADLARGATARFNLALGETQTYRPEDFRVYGRFNRERFDDFVWENDKVAFRMYGEALETWVREPLSSSSVDAWVKKTNRLVANEWYLVDNYHQDHGDGGDFYSAGKTRGCGGSGLIADGRLFTSKNFRKSRVLSRGPIRLLFELEYDAWDVAGVKVKETKRVSLDAGSNFNRFENRYTTEGAAPLPDGFLYATGTKKEKGADVRIDPKVGVLRAWEELNRYGKDGWMGCAVVVDPGRIVSNPELDGNVLVSFRGPAPYFAGTGWDRSGDFKTMADFDAHVNTFAARLASPVSVQVTAR